MHRFSALALIFWAVSGIYPVENPTTAGLKLEILTIGPGKDITSRWGHTAILITDGQARTRTLYDYGTFAFRDGFLGKYLSGQPSFWLSRRTLDSALRYYGQARRPVYSQELKLPEEEIRSFREMLDRTASGPSRFYVYDHLRENCTTKVRDFADKALNGNFSRFASAPAGRTQREMAADYLKDNLALKTAIDLLMTGILDRPITVYDSMNLPMELMKQLDLYRQHSGDKRISAIMTLQGANATDSFPWNPFFIALLCLVFLLLFPLPVFRRWFFHPGIWAAVQIFFGFVLLIGNLTGQSFLTGNLNVLAFNPLAIIWFFRERRISERGIYLFLLGGNLIGLILNLPALHLQSTWPFLCFAAAGNLLLLRRTYSEPRARYMKED